MLNKHANQNILFCAEPGKTGCGCKRQVEMAGPPTVLPVGPRPQRPCSGEGEASNGRRQSWHSHCYGAASTGFVQESAERTPHPPRFMRTQSKNVQSDKPLGRSAELMERARKPSICTSFWWFQETYSPLGPKDAQHSDQAAGQPGGSGQLWYLGRQRGPAWAFARGEEGQHAWSPVLPGQCVSLPWPGTETQGSAWPPQPRLNPLAHEDQRRAFGATLIHSPSSFHSHRCVHTPASAVPLTRAWA